MTVNFRYAPDRSEAEALAHVREVFADCGVDEFVVDDHSGGALPGLSHPAAAAFMEAVGGTAPAQVRLDGRLPLQRARRPRGQLRPRRRRCWPTSATSTWRSTRIPHCEERLRAWLTS